MLTDGIASLLAGEGTITALLGTNTSRSDKTTGVFLVKMPEGSPLPAIAFQQIEGKPIADSHDGPDPLKEARIQFSCQGKTARIAKILQITLSRFFEGYQGELSD